MPLGVREPSLQEATLHGRWVASAVPKWKREGKKPGNIGYQWTVMDTRGTLCVAGPAPWSPLGPVNDACAVARIVPQDFFGLSLNQKSTWWARKWQWCSCDAEIVQGKGEVDEKINREDFKMNCVCFNDFDYSFCWHLILFSDIIFRYYLGIKSQTQVNKQPKPKSELFRQLYFFLQLNISNFKLIDLLSNPIKIRLKTIKDIALRRTWTFQSINDCKLSITWIK